MKTAIKWIIVILALVLATYGVLRSIWTTTNKKALNILIVDKSVKTIERTEHKSFVWILNNQRFVLPNLAAYNAKEDYFGFFPMDLGNELFDFKSYRINELDTYASTFDMAYFADCYGVFSFEWYKGRTKSGRSQKVFGGLNQNDYLLMLKMLENNKLVIAEYNILGTPTNSLIRSKTEALLGLSWSGWTAKSFSNFCIGSPNGPDEWMKNLFESQHMGAWPQEGSGIVLLSNDGIIEILQNGVHLTNMLPYIKTETDLAAKYGVEPNVSYPNWFEIVETPRNTVISNFHIPTTDAGNAVLAKYGLNNTFPAVIKSSEGHHFFYFCGDFANNPAIMGTAKMAGGKTLNHLLTRYNSPSEAAFFGNYYFPLTKTILHQYYESLSK